MGHLEPWHGWMVQWRDGDRVRLAFQESESDADRVSADLRARGFKASYWKLA